MIKNKSKDIIWIGNICPTNTRDNPNQGRVYSIFGLCPSINCMSGGNRQPMVIMEMKDEKHFIAGSLSPLFSDFSTNVAGLCYILYIKNNK